MTWKEERERAYNSCELLTELFNKTLKTNPPIQLSRQVSIRFSGTKPQWKTVFLGNSNLSEGFRTWREVAIFLSGFRVGVQNNGN